MKKTLQKKFASKLSRYKKLKEKTERQLLTGKFYRFSSGRRFLIINKLKKLAHSLNIIKPQLEKAFIAGMCIGLVGAAQAQSNYNQVEGENPYPKALNTGSHSRPFLIDFDKDLDMDMFSGSEDGKIHFFKNNGGRFFELQPETSNPLSMVNMPGSKTDIAFTDLDGDHDLDAVIGGANSVLVYKNDGQGVFTQASGANNPFSTSSFTGDTRVSFADIDKDGDEDFISSSNSSTPRYFINNNDGTYTEKTGIENPFQNFPMESELGFADLDGDDDLDAFIGNKSLSILSYYENNDGAYNQVFKNFFTNIPNKEYYSPAFGDVNGDGYTDAMLGNLDGNFLYFENDGTGQLVKVGDPESPVGGVFYGSRVSVEFEDMNDDNAPDAVIVTDKEITYLENDGTGKLSSGMPNPFENINSLYGSGFASIDFVDIDNDGDQDIYIGHASGISFFENQSGSYSLVNNMALEGVSSGNAYTTVRFFDLNGDGFADAFVPTFNGEIRYFENDQAGSLVEKTGSGNPLSGISVPAGLHMDFEDIDNDGDTDIIIASQSGEIQAFENTGDNTYTETSEPLFGDLSKANASIAFADHDGDGDKDAFIGGPDITVFERSNVITSSKPSALAFKFTIMPNPASSSIRISDISGDTMYEVFDAAGASLLRGRGTYIDVEALKPGLYLLKVSSGNQTGIQQLVVSR